MARLTVSGPVLVDEPVALPNLKAGTYAGHVYPVDLLYRRLIVIMLDKDSVEMLPPLPTKSTR
jgi:hypothetical protein